MGTENTDTGPVYVQPCLGSVGAKPFLDDIQAQLNENRNADRENREPVVIPVNCRFCGELHRENQYDPVANYKGQTLEGYASEYIAPQNPEVSPPDPQLLAIAKGYVSEDVDYSGDEGDEEY